MLYDVERMKGKTSQELREAYESRVRDLEAALERRERELAVLSEVASRVHGAVELTAILDIALEEILSGMDLKAAWVFMGNEKDKVLHLAAERGVSPKYLSAVRKEGLGECLCPEVFWGGHRMMARNTTQCPRMPHLVDGLSSPVAHACIPLRFEGAARGVLNVAARPGELFTDDELRFLETLGHQVCLAVERVRHFEAEQLRNQEARALAAINKAIGGSLDVNAVLTAVGDTARETLGADRVHIFLGAGPRHLVVAHLSGLPHPELLEGQALDLLALRANLQMRAIQERKVYTIDDWTNDERVNRDLARRWDAASGIVIPLVARDHTLGAMTVVRTSHHHWTEEQVEVAEALAAQASVAIENARLYEEAKRAYQELRDAQARIIQTEKMAVLGTFASGLAHEVRNPLNSIALQLSLLERRAATLEGGVAAQIRDLIGIIREEVKRLDSLVSDFLLFSRTKRVHHQPVALDSLLDEVVRLLRPEAKAAGVALRRERCGEPAPKLPLDAERLKQVAINLIRNALEAMPDGGNVVVEDGLLDGSACLRVRDDGPGLPEGIDVFQLFVTTKPKGTGLGLSIAQQIVSEHGGDIAVTSKPGQGAEFTVRLPLNPPEELFEKVSSYEH